VLIFCYLKNKKVILGSSEFWRSKNTLEKQDFGAIGDKKAGK